MNYRTSELSDNGFENEGDEFVSMRDSMQLAMEHMTLDDICDNLLTLAKIAEFRSSLLSDDTPLKTFYLRVSAGVRMVLELNGVEDPAPNIKLENELLYFPDTERSH